MLAPCATILHKIGSPRSPLHVMRSVLDAVCDLDLSNVLDDGCDLVLSDLGLRRHISVGPVMLPYAKLGGRKEGRIGVMTRVIDVMNERWPPIRA